jgi:hypothetical protein
MLNTPNAAGAKFFIAINTHNLSWKRNSLMKKLLFNRLWIFLCSFCLLYLTIVSAHAALVGTSFEGTVTEDNAGNNPFGLSNGDTIFGSAIYDDAELSNVPDPGEQLFLDDYTGWDFSMTLGTFTFTQSDVTDPTYTNFWFVDNKLDGIEFYLEDINIGSYLGLLIEDFNGGQSLFVEDLDTGNPIFLEADWDFENATTPTIIPVPSTILLLGTGLLAAVKLRKKIQRS